MMINTWIAMYLFITLAVIVARELGVPIAPAEEIDFYPLRFIFNYNKKNNIIIKILQFQCRGDIPDPEDDMRRSDFLVPNGYYSDLIILIWGILSLVFLLLCTLIKDWQGMWILVFVSFLVIVSILKVVDLVGRKFGYNILRTNQEMSFYPIRFMITKDEIQ